MIEINDCDMPIFCKNQYDKSSFQKYENETSYEDFFQNHLQNNKPCVFGSWLTRNWPVTNKWVKEGLPDCSYLSDSFGDSEVPVSNCDSKYFNSQTNQTFLLKEYLNYFLQRRKGQDERSLYLKDWHFVKAFPDYDAYVTPMYFASDWLNEFWANRCDRKDDDYRFVYIGPKGSWTPFHADVFRSYSWSSNICGRKRWIFYPPWESNFLKDKFGEHAYDIESPQLKDKSLYPDAHLATGSVEIIQERGETIFVPSNWYHQVWNLEDTISINHNWINGSNIKVVLDFILSSLTEVEKSIEEFSGTDGWVAQCQLILKSVAGMDIQEFYNFLKAISIRRINYMKGDSNICSFPDWKFGKNHVAYDIKKLIYIFEYLFDKLSSDVLEYLQDEERDNPYDIVEELRIFQ